MQRLQSKVKKQKRHTPEDAKTAECKEYAWKGITGNLSVMSGPLEEVSWGDKAKALDCD